MRSVAVDVSQTLINYNSQLYIYNFIHRKVAKHT